MQHPWGRIDESGTVFVTTADGERPVGQWHAGTPEEGLAFYARRYDALVTETSLLERRLASGTGEAKDVGTRATALRSSLGTANVVGDLASLERRLDAVLEKVTERRGAENAARAAATAAANERKRALAEEAEKLSVSSDWKVAGDRLRELAEQWRAVTGGDKRTDTELWRRLAKARDEFGRRRGAHFAALDEQRAAAQKRKEALAAEAEQLSGASDLQATANRLKALMGDWKATGRASRTVEDQLWARFKAAQDSVFARLSAQNAAEDEVFTANQAVKEQLLAEAEALDPAKDLSGAQQRLRELQERWDAAGKVPRAVMGELERRMAAVERRIREAAEARWSRPDPKSSPLVTRLRESVDKLEKKAQRARAAGRDDEAAEIEKTLVSQREWLAQAENPR